MYTRLGQLGLKPRFRLYEPGVPVRSSTNIAQGSLNDASETQVEIQIIPKRHALSPCIHLCVQSFSNAYLACKKAYRGAVA